MGELPLPGRGKALRGRSNGPTVSEAFLRKVDSELAALWTSLGARSPTRAVQECEALCSRLAEKGDLSGAERNKLLQRDWRYESDKECIVSPAVLLVLDEQRVEYLSLALREIVRFVRSGGEPDELQREIAGDVRSAIKRYLAARGIAVEKQGKRKPGRQRPTPEVERQEESILKAYEALIVRHERGERKPHLNVLARKHGLERRELATLVKRAKQRRRRNAQR